MVTMVGCKDCKIKEVPFPDIELFDDKLFIKMPGLFTSDNYLSDYGKEMRPKHLAAIREWQAAEIELNRDLIAYSKDLCDRSLAAWNGRFTLSCFKWQNFNDPLAEYLADNMFSCWHEDENHYGVLVFEKFLSENTRKTTNDYWRFHKGRYDLMMKNLVDANDIIRDEKHYPSFPKFHSLSELDLLLSIAGK